VTIARTIPPIVLAAAILLLAHGIIPFNPDGIFTRAGMFSPKRLDEEPIKVRLAGAYMTVPANCFTSSRPSSGFVDRGYMIEDSAVFSFLLPNMDCRTRENLALFETKERVSPVVVVAVSKLGKNDSADASFSRMLWTLYPPSGAKKEQPTLLYEKGGESVYSAIRYPNGGYSVEERLYVDRQRRSIAKCARPNRLLVPFCKVSFAAGQQFIRMRYSAGYEAQHRAVENLIFRKLDSFRSSK
jgi:hypothetical protein